MSAYEEAGLTVPPIAVIADRQRTLQANITNISSRLRKNETDVLSNTKDIEGLRGDMQRLTTAVERGNRILVGLLVSAVLGSTSVTVAILLSTAKGGLHLP